MQSERFYREYLREDREKIGCCEKEEKEWEKLEGKLDPQVIDIKKVPIEKKREWFRETFGYHADDESVCTRWDKKESK